MKVVSFIADNPAAALARIHEQLGPDAVVLSVRPLPAQGFSRLWQKTRAVEVVAGLAEESDIISRVAQDPCAPGSAALSSSLTLVSPRVPPALHDGTARPHVFIGPAGTGKTTLLCKWMTFSALHENRSARIWRLDAPGANTAEFLNIYAEMLGVAVERFWDASAGGGSFAPGQPDADLLLVDIPGAQPADTVSLRALQDQLSCLPSPRLHLVLNAAYETSILAEQFRAFSAFQLEDLSFTHLDEERDQAKLLDFITGTNCCLRFLSTGQKIPGDLVITSGVPALLPRLPHKLPVSGIVPAGRNAVAKLVLNPLS